MNKQDKLYEKVVEINYSELSLHIPKPNSLIEVLLTPFIMLFIGLLFTVLYPFYWFVVVVFYLNERKVYYREVKK